MSHGESTFNKKKKVVPFREKHHVVAMAAIEQNIVGSCTFHTNQVLFQLGMLIYTQAITEKCQNLFLYVRRTYSRPAIKTALKITKLKIYLKKRNESF